MKKILPWYKNQFLVILSQHNKIKIYRGNLTNSRKGKITQKFYINSRFTTQLINESNSKLLPFSINYNRKWSTQQKVKLGSCLQRLSTLLNSNHPRSQTHFLFTILTISLSRSQTHFLLQFSQDSTLKKSNPLLVTNLGIITTQ